MTPAGLSTAVAVAVSPLGGAVHDGVARFEVRGVEAAALCPVLIDAGRRQSVAPACEQAVDGGWWCAVPVLGEEEERAVEVELPCLAEAAGLPASSVRLPFQVFRWSAQPPPSLEPHLVSVRVEAGETRLGAGWTRPSGEGIGWRLEVRDQGDRLVTWLDLRDLYEDVLAIEAPVSGPRPCLRPILHGGLGERTELAPICLPAAPAE